MTVENDNLARIDAMEPMELMELTAETYSNLNALVGWALSASDRQTLADHLPTLDAVLDLARRGIEGMADMLATVDPTADRPLWVAVLTAKDMCHQYTLSLEALIAVLRAPPVSGTEDDGCACW